MCWHRVVASKTRLRGASKTRLTAISRSESRVNAIRLAIFSAMALSLCLVAWRGGGAPKLGLQVVEQLARALLALAREVRAVEEGILFGEDEARPAARGQRRVRAA
jgi:hypothetical protein